MKPYILICDLRIIVMLVRAITLIKESGYYLKRGSSCQGYTLRGKKCTLQGKKSTLQGQKFTLLYKERYLLYKDRN